MKALNQRATRIFQSLIEGLQKLGDHRTIDNASGAFMAVGVEIIDQGPLGTTYSLNHHYIQEGDVMWDPMMSFLCTTAAKVFPLTFEQSNPPVYTRAAWIEDGKIQYRPHQQADIASFANMWLKNIAEQQGLCK